MHAKWKNPSYMPSLTNSCAVYIRLPYINYILRVYPVKLLHCYFTDDTVFICLYFQTLRLPTAHAESYAYFMNHPFKPCLNLPIFVLKSIFGKSSLDGLQQSSKLNIISDVNFYHVAFVFTTQKSIFLRQNSHNSMPISQITIYLFYLFIYLEYTFKTVAPTQRWCIQYKTTKLYKVIKRYKDMYVCTNLNAFLMVIPNTVTKFQTCRMLVSS